jgi:hypothetical protein
MEDVLSKMPGALSKHIESLMSSCGFDTDPQLRKKFIRNWLKKKAFFDKIVEHQGFRLTDRIGADFKEGIILLTYSGSLLTLSPETGDGKRELVYSSIEMRKDVAVKTEDRDARIDFPLVIHKPMTAPEGKIKKTSPILSLAIEEAQSTEPAGIGKTVRIIGERISKALLLVNQELFAEQTAESELDNRDDLFEKWIILTWFREGEDALDRALQPELQRARFRHHDKEGARRCDARAHEHSLRQVHRRLQMARIRKKELRYRAYEGARRNSRER